MGNVAQEQARNIIIKLTKNTVKVRLRDPESLSKWKFASCLALKIWKKGGGSGVSKTLISQNAKKKKKKRLQAFSALPLNPLLNWFSTKVVSFILINLKNTSQSFLLLNYYKYSFCTFLTAQGHLLRKVVDPATGRFYLGLFLYVADNTQVRCCLTILWLMEKWLKYVTFLLLSNGNFSLIEKLTCNM